MDIRRILLFICIIITWHCAKGDSINEKCIKGICFLCIISSWGNSKCDKFLNDEDHCYDGLDCIFENNPEKAKKCRDIDCENTTSYDYEQCQCKDFTNSTTTTDRLPTLPTTKTNCGSSIFIS